MHIEMLRTMYAYTSWANQRVLEAARNLSPALLHAQAEISFGSVSKGLLHIAQSQQTWILRCQPEAPIPAFTLESPVDWKTLHAYLTHVDQLTSQFIETLDTPALQQIIRYTNDQGEPNAYPLWQLLYHQINHSAQHRSEIAVLLTEFGASPGWLDFLYYLDLRDGTTLHFA